MKKFSLKRLVSLVKSFFASADPGYPTKTPEPVKETDVPQTEPDRPNISEPGQKLLWYPDAVISKQRMKTKGKYPQNYPMGAIVHYTAGRRKGGVQKALDTIRGGIENGYAFLCISEDGQVVQAHPFNEWGYHAGASLWPGLGVSVSSKLVGIEICNAGLLTKKGDKFVSWYGEEFTQDQVRYIASKTANIKPGYYLKYTEAQLESLKNLLMWLKSNNPEVFDFDFVLGHDEVAPNRKQDPGGSLPWTMPEYRALLKKWYIER